MSQCPICLLDLSSPIISYKCGHVVHESCHQSYVEQVGQNGRGGELRCGICRKRVKPGDVISLKLDPSPIISSLSELFDSTIHQNRTSDGIPLIDQVLYSDLDIFISESNGNDTAHLLFVKTLHAEVDTSSLNNVDPSLSMGDDTYSQPSSLQATTTKQWRLTTASSSAGHPAGVGDQPQQYTLQPLSSPVGSSKPSCMGSGDNGRTTSRHMETIRSPYPFELDELTNEDALAAAVSAMAIADTQHSSPFDQTTIPSDHNTNQEHQTLESSVNMLAWASSDVQQKLDILSKKCTMLATSIEQCETNMQRLTQLQETMEQEQAQMILRFRIYMIQYAIQHALMNPWAIHTAMLTPTGTTTAGATGGEASGAGPYGSKPVNMPPTVHYYRTKSHHTDGDTGNDITPLKRIPRQQSRAAFRKENKMKSVYSTDHFISTFDLTNTGTPPSTKTSSASSKDKTVLQKPQGETRKRHDYSSNSHLDLSTPTPLKVRKRYRDDSSTTSSLLNRDGTSRGSSFSFSFEDGIKILQRTLSLLIPISSSSSLSLSKAPVKIAPQRVMGWIEYPQFQSIIKLYLQSTLKVFQSRCLTMAFQLPGSSSLSSSSSSSSIAPLTTTTSIEQMLLPFLDAIQSPEYNQLLSSYSLMQISTLMQWLTMCMFISQQALTTWIHQRVQSSRVSKDSMISQYIHTKRKIATLTQQLHTLEDRSVVLTHVHATRQAQFEQWKSTKENYLQMQMCHKRKDPVEVSKSKQLLKPSSLTSSSSSSLSSIPPPEPGMPPSPPTMVVDSTVISCFGPRFADRMALKLQTLQHNLQ